MATSDTDNLNASSDAELEGTSKLDPAESGSAKLRKLLAKSRAVASGGSREEELPEISVEPIDAVGASHDDYDDEDGMTEVASVPDVSAALEQLIEEPVEEEVEPTSPEEVEPEVEAAPAAPGGPEPSGPLFPTGSHPLPMPSPSPSQSFSGPLPSVQQSGLYQTNVPLAPSGEFGMIPDIGMASRDDIPVFVEPPSGKKRRRRAFFVTGVVGLIAVAIIARLVVDRWVGPTQAIVWTAAGTTLPTLLVGLLLAWPNREKGSTRDLLAGLIPAVVISAAAIFGSTMWLQPRIRALAVPFAQETPTSMQQILEDPSAVVAAAGCKRFAPFYDKTQYRTLFFSALTWRPELAMKCIPELPEETQFAIATSLADRWTRELVAESDSPDEALLCASAGGLATLPLDRATVGARLLQCTLTSPSMKAQECCGESLTATVVDASQWAKHLRESIEYLKDDRTATGVFAMAFHQRNLSPAQKKFAEVVNFTGPKAQSAALEFACTAIEEGRIDVIPHMRAALENDQCEIDPSGVPTTRSMWHEVCYIALAELEADRTLPPHATMCKAAIDLSVEGAVDTARRLASLALQRDVSGSLAKQINAGYDKALNDSLLTEDDDDVPDFITQEERQRARERMATAKDGATLKSNHAYASPSDDNFQAFMKAYKAENTWENKQAVDTYRKEALENREKQIKDAKSKHR